MGVSRSHEERQLERIVGWGHKWAQKEGIDLNGGAIEAQDQVGRGHNDGDDGSGSERGGRAGGEDAMERGDGGTDRLLNGGGEGSGDDQDMGQAKGDKCPRSPERSEQEEDDDDDGVLGELGLLDDDEDEEEVCSPL